MHLLHAIILGVLVASLLGLGVNLLFFRSLAPRRARFPRARLDPCPGPGRGALHLRVRLLPPRAGLPGLRGPRPRRWLLRPHCRHRPRPFRGPVPGIASSPARRCPEGWTGKNWACHQLSQAATGEWLLFTDADTVHSPGALSAAIAMAAASRADLFSAWPRLVTLSLGERLVIPVLHVIALGWFPIAGLRFLQARPRFAARIPAAHPPLMGRRQWPVHALPPGRL